MANPEHLAKLQEDIDAWNDWRSQDDFDTDPDLSGANLKGANLNGANLSRAKLSRAHLGIAKLSRADLSRANLIGADLFSADLNGANLNGAKLIRANLRIAKLSRADLSRANLIGADLNGADLNGADLSDADFRSCNLQYAHLDGANITGARLWETQRAGWSIPNIVCEYAYWDEDAKVPTHYAPGEFERLYSDQTCIEFVYPGGISTFELNTLPAFLHHLATLHPGTNIRFKSMEETGGGAKISISVGDADPETVEKIKADATKVYQAQLALRDDKIKQLEIEKSLLLDEVIPRLLANSLTSPEKTSIQLCGEFHVGGSMSVFGDTSGGSTVIVHQSVNDNTAVLALLKEMMDRQAELNLAGPAKAALESAIHSALAELKKKSPDKSIVSQSLEFLKGTLQNLIGGVGATALAANWQPWITQLEQILPHWK